MRIGSFTKVVARKVGSVQWLRDAPSSMYQDFYRKARAMSAGDVQALCKRHVTHQISQDWGWAEEGAFKPLAVWATDGWDIGAIQEKAQPDDKRVDPTYGWDTYRVRIHSTTRAESHKQTDCLQLLAKARTRALKRKRTDESEVQDKPVESDPEFSSEESGSSDDRDSKKQKEKKAKAKGKGKAKASPAEQLKVKTKAQAKKALQKVQSTLAALRATCAHPLIFEVEELVVDPAKSNLRRLGAIEKTCVKAIQDGIDGFSKDLDDFDFKGAKASDTTLKKKLAKLDRASKA